MHTSVGLYLNLTIKSTISEPKSMLKKQPFEKSLSARKAKSSDKNKPKSNV